MAQPPTQGQPEGIERGEHIILSPSAIVIPLSERHLEQARACLQRSGRITFSFKEVSVTRLPETLLHDGVIID
jgi:hypothetical protein